MDLKNEAQALEYLETAIANNKLVLPTLPEVALKVREAVNSGKASDAELANLISDDPGLAARLLQVANSPMYRARQKVENLKVAITRLGHSVVRSLVTSLAMQQVFQPHSPLLAQYLRDIWKRSVDIAAVSRALATHCGHLDKEQAMLAGLIHQIGKLPILTLAEKFPELAEDKAALDHLLDTLHTTIGKRIMDTWDLPESLSRAAWEYRDFYRDASPMADYVDVVQVAFIENEIATNPNFQIDIAQVSAFRKLGLDPDIQVLEIQGVAEEVEAVEHIFL